MRIRRNINAITTRTGSTLKVIALLAVIYISFVQFEMRPNYLKSLTKLDSNEDAAVVTATAVISVSDGNDDGDDDDNDDDDDDDDDDDGDVAAVPLVDAAAEDEVTAGLDNEDDNEHDNEDDNEHDNEDDNEDEDEKARLHRIDNVYKKRYKYHPPATSTATSTSTTNTTGTNNDDEAMDEICGSSPDFEKYFAQDFYLRSRFGEDRIIYETFFKGNDNNEDDDSSGTSSHHYIELGAFDGVRESNTRFYEKCLGWEGLLIEGNPGKSIYDNLVVNRPNSHRMNYVPSCNQTEEDMNKTIGFHSKRFTNAGIDDVKTAYDGEETVDIPCGTMTQVLFDIFPPHGHVSFFSLDVEGSEHLVLGKALDLEKVKIEMLMIEVQNNFCRDDTCTVRNEVRKIMKEAGYVRFSGKIRASDVFIRQDSKLLQRAIDRQWEETITL